MPRNEHKKVLQQLSEAYQTVRQQEVIEEGLLKTAFDSASKFFKSKSQKRRAQRAQQKADKDAYLQYDRLGAAEKAAAAGKISDKTAGALAGTAAAGAGIGMKKMQDAVEAEKQAPKPVAPKPAPTPVAPVSDEEDTGKRYQVRSVGGEHGQISHLEAEFDELNDVEMYLASQLDRHGVDIDDWKQGDFAGDLRTPDLWEKDENGNLVLDVHEVYEVVDTHGVEYHPGYGKVEDAEHVFKNTEAGYEREDFKHKYSDRVKAVNLAMQALKQFNDNIKHEYPDPEDREERDKAILPLVKAHNLLSVALIALVGEADRDWIMGGQADAIAQSQLDYKPTYGEY